MDRRRNADWLPGSFTKNFSWGAESEGLSALHEHIRVGFAGRLDPVPRALYESRTSKLGRPWYIAANFFLYNGRGDHILPDELVFQAITQGHDTDFDKLATFALNLSLAGFWKGARRGQSWPSLWAHYYISDVLADKYKWDTSRVTADDIQRFLDSSPQYKAEGSRKVATNLNYLYRIGGLKHMSSSRVERWWVNAYFLTLDRAEEETLRSRGELDIDQYDEALEGYNFQHISGNWSLEKQVALRHLSVLYAACGGRGRLSLSEVESLSRLTIPDVAWVLEADQRPSAAFHPTNIRTWKTIPTACAKLAKHAGFEVVPPSELDTFDAETFIRSRTKDAIRRIAEYQIKPAMSAEELDEITRSR